MKNISCVIVFLVCLWTTGDCNIDGWSSPTIATPSGSGTVANMINEGVAAATGVSITATSSDSSAITYTVDEQTPAAPALEIAADGAVTVTAGQSAVSYSSTVTKFVLVVSAVDDGTAGTATVTININAKPVIATHDTEVCIADGSTEGTDLIDLAATDANSGQTISWVIAGGNTDAAFEVTSNGLVQLASGKTLEMATTDTYTLEITAEDNSDTALTATTTVTASVQATCQESGSVAIAMSLMTLLSALALSQLF